MLAEGGAVVAADISADGLADTRARAGADAEMLQSVVMDVGDEESVKSGVREAVDTLGGLDTLVNVAGILRSAHFAETTLADFEQVLRVNLVGTFLVTREALPALRAGNAPAVVNFSSTSAHFAHPYMSAYAASKGGILAMTHALAAEYAREGIRFNSVQPGSISSGMTDGSGESKQSVGPGFPEDVNYRLFGRVAPLLRLPDKASFADPDAVAAVVAMLGSPEAFFITGTEVRIDGGAHM
jgi:NAD(P)-dependent dehydrogenase (short-subunit alcohol dehydrogenase family)